MNYVMSDLHGCYDEYLEMLKRIDFSKHDHLFIIGDVVDRGTGSVKVLQDLMTHKNIRLLMGNHEWFMRDTLKRLPVDISLDNITEYLNENIEITRENINEHRTEHSYRNWTYNGGKATFHEYLDLSISDRIAVMQYLDSLLFYCELAVEKQKYMLVHTIPVGFDKEKPMEEYPPIDLLFNPHINKYSWDETFYDDKILIVGHTATLSISSEYAGKILKKESIINIDCGCAYQNDERRKLGCLRLEDMKEYYV